jgi:NAD(P)-dependent dehydrogenase (short-subunit alcohol dehydrogenase family)
MTIDARRVCLLTGASGRLGIAFCRRYAHRYAIVAVTLRRPLALPTQHQSFVDPLDPQAALPGNTFPVHEIHADLREESELRRVVEVATARYGPIDLLVNAAVASTRSSPLVPEDDGAQELFLLNTLVPIRLAAMVAAECWLGAPEENRRRNRNVVNVSSVYGARLGPLDGRLGVYGASKAALNFLSVEQAAQLQAHGVRVNVLAPTSFPKTIKTETVAEHVVALDDAHVSGSIVVLDEHGAAPTHRGYVLGAGPGKAAATTVQPQQPQDVHPTETGELVLAAARPVLRRPEQKGARLVTVRPRTIPALHESFTANGWVRVPDVLDAERLSPMLRKEAIARESGAVPSEWDRYGLGPDGSYFSGAMSFRSATPGPWLTRVHRHPAVLRLARGITGNPRLVQSENLAYMYYTGGSFIHLHTDVPECELTLLSSVVGQVPPLVVYPRLRGRGVRGQLRLARATGGTPPGGQAVEVPIGGFLAIDGRDLPHRRPEVPGDSTVVLAALCYSEPGETARSAGYGMAAR